MLYNVEDLLDLGQMESGNFRKIIQKFNMKICVQEMLDVQMFKANDKKINLTQTIEIHEDGVLSDKYNDFNVISDI